MSRACEQQNYEPSPRAKPGTFHLTRAHEKCTRLDPLSSFAVKFTAREIR